MALERVKVSFSARHLIEQAKKKSTQDAMNKARDAHERRWLRLEPLFQDYLNGATVAEVSKKYRINRNQIYHEFRIFGIPRIPTEQAKQITQLVLYMQNHKVQDERLQALAACGCIVCMWIKARKERRSDDDLRPRY